MIVDPSSAEAADALTMNNRPMTAQAPIANGIEHVVVLTPVEGKAAWCRPFGRPRPSLCAPALHALVGAEKWSWS